MPRDQDPVRLRVSYQSPRSLLGEFTRSVGRQAVALQSHRPAQIGTRFLFELTAEGVRDKVEVMKQKQILRGEIDGPVRADEQRKEKEAAIDRFLSERFNEKQ